MKHIVCYGDSNTWGFKPKKECGENWNMRFDENTRWTGVLQQLMGGEYKIIEEGLNGRTSAFDDPQDDTRNGLKYIATCMQTNMPIDMVIVMLGTNDVKSFFPYTPYVVANGFGRIVKEIRKIDYGKNGKIPEVLVVSPIAINEDAAKGWIGGEFGMDSVKKNAELPVYLEKVAREQGAHFFNIGAYVTADPADGIHMNEQGHRIMAEKMFAQVKNIIG